MKMKRFTSEFSFGGFVTLMALSGLVLACGRKPVETNARIKYGYLPDNVAMLLKLSPGDSVLVCGSEALNLRGDGFVAVKKWADAAGRSDLRIEENPSCDSRWRFTASIQAAYNGPHCEGNVLGYHTQNGQHHDIVTCSLAQKEGNTTATMLHEVGHAWGLCDQYSDADPSRIVFHQNCESDYHSSSAARSIMGGGYPGSPSAFTEDDILGIRIGACRADIPSNGTWARRSAQEVDGWKTPAFLAEIKRLQSRGLRFIPECTSQRAEVVPAPSVTPLANPPAAATLAVSCEAFRQVVNVKSHFFHWGTFSLAIKADGDALGHVRSVTYPVHASFGTNLLVTNPAGGFETRSLYTMLSSWETSPAALRLDDGRTCQVPGVAVRVD